MGFLSSITGILGGDNSSSSSSQAGFSLLPSEIQSAYKNYANQVNNQIPNITQMYTPLQQTGDETNAFNAIRRGFTPTQESLNSDISMLMNPFDKYVIDGINRQANSDFSILKQNATQAGQFGSNRQMLGANDIENTRQMNIGSLMQNQYNQAIGQVFNNLIPQRQNDAQGLLGIGNFQRGLDQQTNTAPVTGLQELAKALGVLPQSGGSTSTSESSSNGGLLKTIGGLAGAAGGATELVGGIGKLAGLFSDVRLKENIEPLGKENGHNIYEFSYLDSLERFVGVLADEVELSHPDAVEEINGFKSVNYNMIGVEFREAV